MTLTERSLTIGTSNECRPDGILLEGERRINQPVASLYFNSPFRILQMMDERFRQGIRDFNTRRFFEAHDIWEDLWHEYRELDRLCIQGLIQVAVGFYHLENNNYKGSCSQFTKAVAKLDGYRPQHFGVETEQFVNNIKHWLSIAERLRAGEAAAFSSEDFPRIEYIEKETTIAHPSTNPR